MDLHLGLPDNMEECLNKEAKLVYSGIFSLGEQIGELEQKKTRLLAALGNTVYEKNYVRQELLIEEIRQIEKEIAIKNEEMEGLEYEI